MLLLCGFVGQAWIFAERDNFREIPKQTEKKNDDYRHAWSTAAVRQNVASAEKVYFYIFNCDNSYKLEIVENFLLQVKEKNGFKIWVDRLNFGLQLMVEVCEKTLPKLVMDVALSLLCMQTNLVSPSTKTTLALVTRYSTDFCVKKRVDFNIKHFHFHSFCR